MSKINISITINNSNNSFYLIFIPFANNFYPFFLKVQGSLAVEIFAVKLPSINITIEKLIFSFSSYTFHEFSNKFFTIFILDSGFPIKNSIFPKSFNYLPVFLYLLIFDIFMRFYIARNSSIIFPFVHNSRFCFFLRFASTPNFITL